MQERCGRSQDGYRQSRRTREAGDDAGLTKSNVVLRGGGLDESPHCYKRLPEVLAAHGETIRVLSL